MKKILLVDYIGDSDQKGHPVGHPLNVGKIYADLLKNDFQILRAVPYNFAQYFDNVVCTFKWYAVRATNQVLLNYIHEYLNLNKLNRMYKNENFWFYNTDYVLYLWLMLHRKRSGMVLCFTYVNVPSSENCLIKCIKNNLIKAASRKIDLFISSNIDFCKEYISSFYMPDYYFIPEKYNRYLTKKENLAVCVGTVTSQNKQIIELIEAFNENGYSLVIAGQFYEQELYEKAKRIAKKNITIINKFISDDEYYGLLGKAKFSVLPYIVSSYIHKTSAVILESIFLHAIPIAPKFILEKNNIEGIGYCNINELKNVKTFIDAMFMDEEKFYKRYDMNEISSKLLLRIQDLSKNKN